MIKSQQVRVRQEGSVVCLIVDGKRVADIPWRNARQIAAALKQKANLAEEIENVERAINDNAIIARSGAPFALSTNKKIKEAAWTDAQWDTALRKWMKSPRDNYSKAEFSREIAVRNVKPKAQFIKA